MTELSQLPLNQQDTPCVHNTGSHSFNQPVQPVRLVDRQAEEKPSGACLQGSVLSSSKSLFGFDRLGRQYELYVRNHAPGCQRRDSQGTQGQSPRQGWVQ